MKSPLPWKARETHDSAGGIIIEHKNNRAVLIDYMFLRAEDAEYIVEAANNYERLQQENKELVEAFDKACDRLTEITGSCPSDSLDIDMDCENKCGKDMEKTCWKEYFIKQSQHNAERG